MNTYFSKEYLVEYSGLDDEMVDELKHLYLQALYDTLHIINSRIIENDYFNHDLYVAIHTIKGTSGSVGATILVDYAQDACNAIKSENYNQAVDYVVLVKQHVKNAIEELQNM